MFAVVAKVVKQKQSQPSPDSKPKPKRPTSYQPDSTATSQQTPTTGDKPAKPNPILIGGKNILDEIAKEFGVSFKNEPPPPPALHHKTDPPMVTKAIVPSTPPQKPPPKHIKPNNPKVKRNTRTTLIRTNIREAIKSDTRIKDAIVLKTVLEKPLGLKQR